MEMNKKRELELQRLRRELEESSVHGGGGGRGAEEASQRCSVGAGREQCESLQRTRAKLGEREQSLRLEVDDLAASLDTLQKAKVSSQEIIICCRCTAFRLS